MTTDKIPFINSNKQYELADAEQLESLPRIPDLLHSFQFLNEAHEIQRKHGLRLEETVNNELVPMQGENARLNEYIDDLTWELKVAKHYAVIVSILSLGIIAFYTLRG
jgi:hypothetical protein